MLTPLDAFIIGSAPVYLAITTPFISKMWRNATYKYPSMMDNILTKAILIWWFISLIGTIYIALKLCHS